MGGFGRRESGGWIYEAAQSQNEISGRFFAVVSDQFRGVFRH